MNTFKITSLLSFWFKPREGVTYLQQRPKVKWPIMLGLVMTYFLQFTAFIFSIDEMYPLLSLKGSVVAVLVLLFVAFGTFIFLQGGTLAFWLAAKCFKGQGTFSQTQPALVWTLLESIPIGFFWMILYAAFQHEELVGAKIIGMLSYIGGVVTLIYVFIVLLVTLSETNKISLWRAFFSVALGSVFLGGILFAFFKLKP